MTKLLLQEIYRKSKILKDLFLGIFRLIFQEEILLEQDDVPIGWKEHQSLVTGNLQDINFTISLGFPKTWLRLIGLREQRRIGTFLRVPYCYMYTGTNKNKVLVKKTYDCGYFLTEQQDGSTSYSFAHWQNKLLHVRLDSLRITRILPFSFLSLKYSTLGSQGVS